MDLRVTEAAWRSCESPIQAICAGNKKLTPYQSWEFLDRTGLGLTARHPENMIGIKGRNFILYDGDTPVAVAPLLVRKVKNIYELRLRGSLTGAGNLDFIFSPDLTYEQFLFLVKEIEKRFVSVRWDIERISEKSVTCDYWKRYCGEKRSAQIGSDVCVEIPLVGDYEDWYASLSKNTKNNIHKCYNRFSKEEKKVDILSGFDTKIPKRLFSETLKVASFRALEYDGRTQKWLWVPYYLLKSFDPVIRFLRQSRHCFYVVVRIDGAVAASMIGVYSADGRMIIPRVSYHSRFSRYSPGKILVNETVKLLTAAEAPQKAVSLDLSRGAERYKYDFGGREHFNYSFSVMPE